MAQANVQGTSEKELKTSHQTNNYWALGQTILLLASDFLLGNIAILPY